jgi:hypothetical protein
MSAAVDDPDTAVTKPGINPLTFFNVITELSAVFTVKFPNVPTYNPPYNLPELSKPLPEAKVIDSPPVNCELITYDF